MHAVRFREVIGAELARRQRQNARYSLRGFARALGVHHATLSRLLNGDRPLQARTIWTLGPRIGLSSPQLQSFVSNEDMAAVAMAIARPAFHPDSRWLASVAGISVDRVNVALQALLRCGRLRMLSASQWKVMPPNGAK
jgi:plasmid maintenance system antidote protein VapI